MNGKKYIGVYYSDALIRDKSSLATFCLFFDEIHLVTISDFARDPTAYLKNLPAKVQMGVLGKVSQEKLERAKSFYQFALDNQPLLKEVIFYHPHLLDSGINTLVAKLIQGKARIDDFLKFFSGKTPEMEAFEKFCNKYPGIKDEIILKVAPTALKLAKDNDWILIGDNAKIPVPILSEKFINVRNLTSILAEECIRIALPKCQNLSAENILEARKKLKTLLIPFRMTMQKLSSELKTAIRDKDDFDEIKAEARFIAESQVEPALYEIRRKIEIEKDKLWLRIFGKVVSWIPFIAKSYALPSPENIYQAVVKIYGDVGTVGEDINEYNVVKETGLSFLLGIGEKLEN